MSNRVIISIDDTEVLKAFENLREHARKVLKETGEDAAKLVVDIANRKAIQPVVEARVAKNTTKKVELEIGVPRDKFYVAIFETGAQTHEIDPHKKKSLYFEGSQGAIFSRLVNHPGIPARPFLRPALDEAESAVSDLVRDKILHYRANE